MYAKCITKRIFKKNLRIFKKFITFLFETMFGKTEYKSSMGRSDVLFHQQWCFVDCVWNEMAHAQKPDFVFRRNEQVHLSWQGRQFSRLLAGELCISACRVCTARASLCSAVMWCLLVTHSILLFPLHFSHASPCAITFQTQSTNLSSARMLRTTGTLLHCYTNRDVPHKRYKMFWEWVQLHTNWGMKLTTHSHPALRLRTHVFKTSFWITAQFAAELSTGTRFITLHKTGFVMHQYSWKLGLPKYM
jgi:hypothetical protein